MKNKLLKINWFILKKLLEINKYLYHLKFHVPLFISWIFLFSFGYFTEWFVFGFLLYTLLLSFNLIRNGKKELVHVFKTNGIISFLVGANIIIILGPLSLLIMTMMIIESKN